jgi:CRP-like cAMP-binding protein
VNRQNICEFIKGSSLFTDLDESQCNELSLIATIRSLADGEILISQGEIDESLHIVASGLLSVERATAGVNPVILHLLKPGDLAGELGFVDGTEHTATLRAKGPCEIVSINRQDFEALLLTNAGLVYGVMRGIVRTIHRIVGDMDTQFVEMSNYISKSHGRY